MAKSGQLTLIDTGLGVSFLFDWEVKSQDAVTNASTISWKIIGQNTSEFPFYLGGGYGAGHGLTVRYPTGEYTFETLQYNFVPTYDEVDDVQIPIGSTVLHTGESVIVHQSLGNQEFQARFVYSGLYRVQSWGSENLGSKSGSYVSDFIDYIVRSVSFLTCPTEMTDEEIITITYSNPLGDAATLLQAGISLTTSDTNMFAGYRDISKTAGSYTFNFTSTELAGMYKVLDDRVDIARLRVFLKSTVPSINGTSETKTEHRDIIVTFKDYKPTIDVKLKATDSVTASAVGNNDGTVFICGVSEVYFELNQKVKKGATQKAIWIGNGGDDKYTSTGTFTNVSTNYFSAYVLDSRGYQVSQEITIGEGDWSAYRWVKYFPLTVRVKKGAIDSSGKLTVTITGKFFNGNFGAKSNTFKYQYNIRPTSSGTDNWSSIITVSPSQLTIDNDGNYSYTFTKTGFDYNERYAFTLEAFDEIMSEVAETSTVVGAIPVFDWGKDDFNFNVPVTFGAGFVVPNDAYKVLINGQFALESSSAGINLPEPISAQATGIVLIFTPYNSSTGYADDTKCMPFFISKKAVEYARATNNQSNPLFTFFLMDKADFSTIGSKSVYIGDQRIAGYNTNAQTGTKNGITFDNTKFCLRTILGV